MQVPAIDPLGRVAIHPFHAAMLAGAAPLFVGALLADWAYAKSYQVQWGDFASWLLIGAMVPATLALACALVERVRGGGAGVLYPVVLAAAWIVGVLDALHHARDAWAIMPVAPVLSLVAAVLACIATWMRFSKLRGLPASRTRGAA